MIETYGSGTYGGTGTYSGVAPAIYHLRLGPLAFAWPLSPTGEQLGGALEAVGAVLTPAEPRPRPFKLSLPVRGADAELDTREAGYRLRRQVRQLLDNARWRNQGLYLHFAADPELDGWLLVGGGDLEETDAGVTFGDWTLELADCYLVGRPNRQRLGRRLELADRRTGLVPLDTRGLLYSTDHAAQALPDEPLIIPGDVAAELLSRNRAPSTLTDGPTVNGRKLWKAAGGAIDGDVASFLPALLEQGLVSDPALEYVELEDAGSVRAWDTTASTVDLTGDQPTYNDAADHAPARYGWERIYGDAPARDTPIAVENGICRLVWTTPELAGGNTMPGLAIEVRDTVGTIEYFRLAVVTGADAPVREVSVIELGPERAVIEWRAAQLAMRAILQRGWRGPRLEAYCDDPSAAAALEWVPAAGGATDGDPQTPAWVKRFNDGLGRGLLFALGRDSDTVTNVTAGTGRFGIAGRRIASTGAALVAQVAPADTVTDDELASLAIADARSIPVLVTR